MNNRTANSYLSSIATIVIALTALTFPLFFLTTTTDFFTFPKQILIVGVALLLFIIWGIKSVADRKVVLNLNPLNLPVLLFAIVVILSVIFSTLREDSIIQSLPIVMLVLFFYMVINFINEKSSFTLILTALIIGSGITSLLSIFAKFNIFLLPFSQFRTETFNTFGSPVQYAGFLIPLLVLCLASLIMVAKKSKLASIATHYAQILQIVASVIFIVALVIVAYQSLPSAQRPILLPFNDGFQIAFAAISQDSTRLIQSLLLGSGYGTFTTDFTRFVNSSFNSYPFWSLSFSFSSSFILGLLTTLGVLGLLSYVYIFVNFVRSQGKNFSNPLFLSVLSVFILSLLIPFSYAMVFLLFMLLALFVSHRTIEGAKNFDGVILNFTALKQGLISVTEDTGRNKRENYTLPIIVLAVAILVTIYVLFYLTGLGTTPRKGYADLVGSDMKFAKSLTADALRSGTQTYTLQTEAITQYPYRSDYYRLFSQINLALAANLVKAQGTASPSAQVQQNIIGLLQQSINSARQAVTLSPSSSLNWQNLGQVYRNLIGVGQNADQFAIASYNQAINLNPSNPGLRIELGGIYYQLQQWDAAQNQFTIATQLKPDYPNAYYNLGHALEQKNDLQGALSQFETVKQLVANDKANLDIIDKEIKALQDQIGKEAKNNTQTNIEPAKDATPLGVNQPEANFPPKNPRVGISPPPTNPATAVSPTPETSGTPAPSESPSVSPTK